MLNIIVIASIIVKEEYKEEVYKALVELHELTHKNDEGCIQYELHKDIDVENSYTFVETWKDASFLEQHSKKEHFVKFAQFIDGKIEDMTIKKLTKENL